MRTRTGLTEQRCDCEHHGREQSQGHSRGGGRHRPDTDRSLLRGCADRCSPGKTLTATVGDSISMTRGFVRERAAGLTARAIASAYPRTLLVRGPSVSGTITYRERIHLSPGAVVKVSLSDTSYADGPSVLVAHHNITAGGTRAWISECSTTTPV